MARCRTKNKKSKYALRTRKQPAKRTNLNTVTQANQKKNKNAIKLPTFCKLSRYLAELGKLNGNMSQKDWYKMNAPRITRKTPRREVHIGGKKIIFYEERWGKEKCNDHARQAYEERTTIVPDAIYKKPTDAMVEELKNVMKGTMRTLWGCTKGISAEEADKSMQDSFEASEEKKIRRTIEEWLQLEPQVPILEPEEIRHRANINNQTQFLVDDSLFYQVGNLTEKSLFEPITEAKKLEPATKLIVQDLENSEKDVKLNCDCGDVCNPTKCECCKIKSVFKGNVTYSCSEKCSCKGRCSYSIPEPSPRATEIRIGPNARKGLFLVATEFRDKGEIISKMTGVIRPKSDKKDEYALNLPENMFILHDFYRCTKDKKTFEAFKKSINNKYLECLEEVLKIGFEIDPLKFGNIGRYLSSSCVPNLEVFTVLKTGGNPTHAEIYFKSILPIIPNDILSFLYSPEYVCRILSKTCDCGNLVCVRNMKWYPYITDEHVSSIFSEIKAVNTQKTKPQQQNFSSVVLLKQSYSINITAS